MQTLKKNDAVIRKVTYSYLFNKGYEWLNSNWKERSILSVWIQWKSVYPGYIME